MATNLHNDVPLGQLHTLQILEGDWARQRQVSLGYAHGDPLLILPLVELLNSRTVAEDDRADDDDDRLQGLLSRARDALHMHPMNGHQFVLACQQAGYNPDQHGYDVALWVVDQLQQAARRAHPDQLPAKPKRTRPAR